jgi:hypothetical protein
MTEQGAKIVEKVVWWIDEKDTKFAKADVDALIAYIEALEAKASVDAKTP